MPKNVTLKFDFSKEKKPEVKPEPKVAVAIKQEDTVIEPVVKAKKSWSRKKKEKYSQ